MRVFISYGHDRNVPLVERIRADLDAAGHVTWIDTSAIKTGDDWRRRIVDGLKDSDWTLAFLSKHSTRDPGVCLDELAIALKEKGGAISTVLVEPVDEVRPPVTVAHIQYLDMSDWTARQTADPAAFETWYRAKLDEILRTLAGKTGFAGEIEELARRLRPIAHDADIEPLIGGFVGRQWLLDRLETWRLGESERHVFWVTGDPGSGKSAFAAWIAHFVRANTVGLNLCRYNLDDRRDPVRVIRTLMFQLATRLHDYRRLLLDRLRLHDPDGAELARKPPADLFDWLVIQPLRSGIDGGRRGDRFVLVIDALDETVRDGRSALAEVLAEAAPRLPGWIALVVTSRRDLPVMRQFAGVREQPIEAEAADNREDLRVYAKGWLGASGRPAEEVARLVERIDDAADGNFLYLRKLREGVEEGVIDLAAEGLPPGLVGLYERWFRRQFPDVAAYERDVLPVLQVIVAAEHSVPETVLTALFGWSVRKRARHLEQLGSLFERRADCVAPFHKSLRDWLCDEHAAGADFVVDAAAGRERLFGFLWERFAAGARDGVSDAPDEFILAELPRLVASRTDRDLAERFGAADDFSAILGRAVHAARQSASRFAWPRALAWCEMAARLGGAAGEPGLPFRGFALEQKGDVFRTIGRTVEALAACERAKAVADRLAKQYPGDTDRLRNLSISHNKIGDVKRAQGDLAGALDAYAADLAIAARLAAQDPGNALWQRDLSVSHERIGDVKRAQGDLAGALAAYQAARAIRERLAAQDPGNAEWQRDLSISHDRIGDVKRAQGDLAGTLAEYQAARAIRERLSAQDPGNALWQRDLSVSHERIGDVKSAQSGLAGALAAYQASRAIRERLAAQDPGNAEWQRDLSVSHNNIGDVKRAQGDLAGVLAAYQAARAITERLAAQDPGNALWQRDLSYTYTAIGNARRDQGDHAAALEAYRRGLDADRRLAVLDPSNAQGQRDLFVSEAKVAATLVHLDDIQGARIHAALALQQARILASRFPQDPQHAKDVEAAEALARAVGLPESTD